MNFLSINSNGFGRGDYKIPLIKQLIEKNKIDFMGLQETKRKTMTDMLLKALWGSHDFEAVCSNSLGQGGGLLCIWNKHVFTKHQAIIRNDCIIVTGTWLETGEDICIINVYASQIPGNRVEQRNFLTAFLNNTNGKK